MQKILTEMGQILKMERVYNLSEKKRNVGLAFELRKRHHDFQYDLESSKMNFKQMFLL